MPHFKPEGNKKFLSVDNVTARCRTSRETYMCVFFPVLVSNGSHKQNGISCNSIGCRRRKCRSLTRALQFLSEIGEINCVLYFIDASSVIVVANKAAKSRQR